MSGFLLVNIPIKVVSYLVPWGGHSVQEKMTHKEKFQITIVWSVLQ